MPQHPAPITNTFGTEGDLVVTMLKLVPAARSSFERFLVDHQEVQAASMALREDVFTVWMDNNVGRFLRQFERAGR